MERKKAIEFAIRFLERLTDEEMADALYWRKDQVDMDEAKAKREEVVNTVIPLLKAELEELQ
jgi:hypothetical protein